MLRVLDAAGLTLVAFLFVAAVAITVLVLSDA